MKWPFLLTRVQILHVPTSHYFPPYDMVGVNLFQLFELYFSRLQKNRHLKMVISTVVSIYLLPSGSVLWERRPTFWPLLHLKGTWTEKHRLLTLKRRLSIIKSLFDLQNIYLFHYSPLIIKLWETRNYGCIQGFSRGPQSKFLVRNLWVWFV